MNSHGCLYLCLALTLLIPAMLPGCVGNRPYRLQGIADEIYEKKFPGQKPPNEVGEAGDRHYHLSFVAINAQPLEKVKLATLPDSYSSAQS